MNNQKNMYQRTKPEKLKRIFYKSRFKMGVYFKRRLTKIITYLVNITKV